MRHALFVILGVVLCIVLDNPYISSFCLFTAIALAAYFNREHANILHLCAGIMLIMVLERLVIVMLPQNNAPPYVWENNRIFLTHFVFDLILFAFLIYRGSLSRWLYQKMGRSTKGLYLTNADISMFGVMILFILTDLAAVLENLLRNLDYIGFSEEIAKPLWELNWIYYNYEYLKSFLMGLQFLMLWTTTSKMAKQKTKYLDRFQG